MIAHGFRFASPLVERLGWTLVHFLWQGAAIAAILALSLAILKRSAPAVRHACACGSLLLMAIAPIVTFAVVRPDEAVRLESSRSDRLESFGPQAIPKTEGINVNKSNHSQAFTSLSIGARLTSNRSFTTGIERRLPFVVAGWLAGVIVLSIRLAGGVVVLRRLRNRGVRPLNEWYEVRDRLLERMRIHRVIDLFESSAAQVPLVLGVFKPVVLIPASAVLGLSAAEFEAILAHEFAHVMRHDLFINMLQNVMETLLFYHPAVWRVSGVIRRERESCCDDVAVAVCGDRLSYARALASLESIRTTSSYAIVTASGGSLVDRIRRILMLEDSRMRRTKLGSWIAPAIAAVIGLALFSAVYARREASAQDKKPSAAVAAKLLASLRETAQAVALMKDERRAAQTLIDIARAQAKLGDNRSARETIAMIVRLIKDDQKIFDTSDLLELSDVQYLADDFQGALQTSYWVIENRKKNLNILQDVDIIRQAAAIQAHVGEKAIAYQTLRRAFERVVRKPDREGFAEGDLKEFRIHCLTKIGAHQFALGDRAGAKDSLAAELEIVKKLDDGVVCGKYLIQDISHLQAILEGKALADASFERGLSMIEKEPFVRENEIEIGTAFEELLKRGEIDRAFRLIDDDKIPRSSRGRIIQDLVMNDMISNIAKPLFHRFIGVYEIHDDLESPIDHEIVRQTKGRIFDRVPSLEKSRRYQIDYQIGWASTHVGDLDGALRAVRAAVQEAGGDAGRLSHLTQLYMLISYYYYKAGDLPNARKMFTEIDELIDGPFAGKVDANGLISVRSQCVYYWIVEREFDKALETADKLDTSTYRLDSLLQVADGLEKNGDHVRAEGLRAKVESEIDRIETDQTVRETYFPRSLPGVSKPDPARRENPPKISNEEYVSNWNYMIAEWLIKAHRFHRAIETANRIPNQQSKSQLLETIVAEQARTGEAEDAYSRVMKLEPEALKARMIQVFVGSLYRENRVGSIYDD